MNKDKHWLSNEITNLAGSAFFREENEPVVNIIELRKLVEQLDEPELPVIPQFVADWYEKNKREITLGIYMVMKGIIKKHDSECSKIEDWFNRSIHNPVETVVLMKSGYTIEKEPEWTVKLDNGRYVDNFIESITGVEVDLSHRLGCTAPIIFRDKSKAEAVALLVNGEVVEVTDNV